jgi:hypothetical protein
MEEPDFSSIDQTISNWITKNDLTLFTGEKNDRRFVYLSDSNGMCIQISIQPPRNNSIKINIWQIEPEIDGDPIKIVDSNLNNLRDNLDNLFEYIHSHIFGGT